MPAVPKEKEKKSKGLGVKKAAGLKRTRTGCAECRRKRAKCDETKPICVCCSKAGSECLYPLELPREALFQPYGMQQQMLASRAAIGSATPPGPSPTPTNAVASSSRTRIAASSADLFYHTPTGFLQIAYPDPEERHLIYHFLSLLSKWVVAPLPLSPSSTPSSTNGTPLPTHKSAFNPPSLDLVMPHMDITAFLSARARSTTAEEALSLSLLAVGAVHLSYLHHQSATTFLFDRPDDPTLAQGGLDAHERYRELSESLVDSTLALTKSSMLLLGAKKRRRPSLSVDAMTVDEDATLGTMSVAMDGCLLARCLAGGGNFGESLSLAKAIVGMRGGPVRILQQAKRDPIKLRRSRVILESICLWEVFSCLSTGREPDLAFPNGLSSPTDPPSYVSIVESSASLASWFSAFAPAPGTSAEGSTDGDWETVEGLLGFTRGLVQILHRVVSLYARSRPPGWSALEPTAGYPFAIDEVHVGEAHALMRVTECWSSAFASRQTDELTRLELGDLIYTHSLSIILQLDLLGYPPSHPDVQSRAKAIVSLILQCFESSGFVVAFMWPLLISASCATTDEDRSLARAALQTMRSASCFDLNSAWSLLDRVWEKQDGGDQWASWRSVAVEGGGVILV